MTKYFIVRRRRPNGGPSTRHSPVVTYYSSISYARANYFSLRSLLPYSYNHSWLLTINSNIKNIKKHKKHEKNHALY